MTKAAINHYPIPDINDLPEDLRTFILNVNEKMGFVPNVFLVLAYRPDELRALLPTTMQSWSVREGSAKKTAKLS